MCLKCFISNAHERCTKKILYILEKNNSTSDNSSLSPLRIINKQALYVRTPFRSFLNGTLPAALCSDRVTVSQRRFERAIEKCSALLKKGMARG